MSGRALVTGASGGIGAAVVRALAGQGWEVWALARRAGALEALAAETGCHALAGDVTDAAALAPGIEDIAPDLLVNNAGRGAGFAGLVNTAPEDIAATVGTNVTALLEMSRLVLPGMIARGRGQLVMIGSVAGLYPINSAVYGGSKGAVHLVSQNLRLELRGTGVRVSEICPARVETEFFEVATGTTPEVPVRIMSPEDVAGAVMFAVEAPEHVNVSMVEIQPVGQTFGAAFFDPVTS